MKWKRTEYMRWKITTEVRKLNPRVDDCGWNEQELAVKTTGFENCTEDGRRCRGWPDVRDYRVPVCRMPSKGYRVPGFLRRHALRNWRARIDVGRMYRMKSARSNKNKITWLWKTILAWKIVYSALVLAGGAHNLLTVARRRDTASERIE